MENTFLKYINDWKESTVDDKISKDEQAKRCLSYQTIEGIRITGTFHLHHNFIVSLSWWILRPRQIYRTVIFLLFNQMYQTVIILYCDLFLVRSFLGLIPELLRIDGVKYVLTDRFNQDPLEEHFGKQRTKGGGVDNPTILQYMYNERKIIVSKSDMIIKGNTRGRKRDAVVIDTTDQKELPKRSKQRKDKI